MNYIWNAILLAMSLCMDCFAVSTCSSVGLSKPRLRDTLGIALAFAVVQAALFVAGYGFGSLLAGMVSKIAKAIASLLLAGVGVNMIREAFSEKQESLNLNGLRNVLLGATASSIDALIVGISLSMVAPAAKVIIADASAIFFFTMVSVVTGISVGCAIGSRFGRPAVLVGGIVLVVLAVLTVV